MIPMFNKIAVIGDGDLISGLKIFGFDTFAVKEKDSERKIFKEILERQYSLCFIQEVYFLKLKDLVLDVKEKTFPLILSIPDHREVKGLAKRILKEITLKAIGQDIWQG